MKAKWILCASICCLLATLIFLGCTQGNVPKTKAAVPTKEDMARLQNLFLSPYFEQISLLAVKYKIDSETAKKIVFDYLSKHDFLFAGLSGNKDVGNIGISQYDDFAARDRAYQNTIRELSAKYNVRREKLAALISDFKVYYETREKQEGN
jgi:hypothetical protein